MAIFSLKTHRSHVSSQYFYTETFEPPKFFWQHVSTLTWGVRILKPKRAQLL